MNAIMKRGIAFILTLMLIFSLVPAIQLTANAADVNYQYGSTGSYSKVIKNWGVREEVATFLSPNAVDFYSETSYESLITKSGSSNLSVVNTSALYVALNQLMKNAHKKTTSYDQTRDLYQYTDCQNNGSPSNKISAFYSGKEVGPDWDSGKTWNREHTWPNSKGGSGQNENDIMMLRPETVSSNSSRGNTAYGKSSGYYFPNLTSTYDVRGDVARIVLYVYVRWGTEEQEVLNNMWGSSGVIESKAVLLEWMEADPVDTWEMGRNDSVQSITGTRNVFVDYPELAFALFNEEIPEMTTPSGNAGAETYQITAKSNNNAYGTVSLNGSVITATPASGYYAAGYQVTSGSANVIQNGNTFTVKPTSDCTVTITFAKAPTYAVRVLENGILKASQQVQANNSYTLPAFSGSLPEGYSFLGWSTSEMTDVSKKPTVYAPGTAVTITQATTFYAVASFYDGEAESGESTWNLVTDISQIGVGSEIVIAAKDYNYALSTEQKSNNRGQVAITKNGDAMTYDSSVAVLTLENGTVAGSYAFQTGSGYLYAASSSSNYLRTETTLSANSSWAISVAEDGTASVIAQGNNTRKTMQYNQSSSLFACYAGATQKAICLYVAQSSSGATTYTTSWSGSAQECQHTETNTVKVDATCTENGSITVSCASCGTIISTSVLPAGHIETAEEIPATLTQQGYTLLSCRVCGEELGREDYVAALTDISGWSLTLGSDLAVNFQIAVDPSIRNTAKIYIGVRNDTTYVYNASNLKAGTGNNLLASVKVAAPQMTDTVFVQIINGDDKTEVKEYSVKAYADAILSGNYPETTKNLVAQMLHYGAAAQTYFGYNTDFLANDGLTASNQAVPETNMGVTASGEVEGIEFYGATLVFRDRIAIRYYFTVTGDIDSYTFAVNGTPCEAVQKGSHYYVEFADINPQDLDNAYAVTVNNAYTVNYSPMNYIVNVRQNGSEKMQALVQALYDYYLAAESYLAA